MGGNKDYLESGGFKVYRYEEIGYTDNGIKVIKKKDGIANTPMNSNTPNTAYAKIDDATGLINQISTYNGRQKSKDIDIGHIHTNPENKKRFEESDIHIHDYINGKRT